MARRVPGFQGSSQNWAKNIESFLKVIGNPVRMGEFLFDNRMDEAPFWEPEHTASGTMGWTPSMPMRFWVKIGRMVFFAAHITGTTVAPASNTLYFTLPVLAKITTASWPVWVSLVDTTMLAGTAKILANQKQVQVMRYDASNFGIGAVEILAAGFYEALE